MKSVIDMSKSNALYMVGLGSLMLASLALNMVPQFTVGDYLVIPHQRAITGALFAVGGLFGLLTVTRHTARGRQPWKVPQSQVSISFAFFFVLTMAAVVLSR